MEQLIAAVAERSRIGLFRRFEIMRQWQATSTRSLEDDRTDGLHMTDQSYGCLAVGLAEALARTGGRKSAPRRPRRRGSPACAAAADAAP